VILARRRAPAPCLYMCPTSSRPPGIAGRSPAHRVGRSRPTGLIVAAAAILLALSGPGRASPVAAQSDLFEGGELWLGLGAWSGRQAELFRPGLRALLALSAEAAPNQRVLLEGLYGRFSPRSGGTAVTESGVSVAARFELDPTRGWVPYLQGRVGYHRLSGTGAGSGATQTGLLLGPEVGVERAISASASLLGAVEAAWVWYGDVVGRQDGTSGTGGYAFRFGLRVGVSLRKQERP
jgi:hypothetical protein